MVEEGGRALAADMKPREEGPRRRPERRNHRRGQNLRQGRRIRLRRPPAHAGTADQPRPGHLRTVGQRGQAHGRRTEAVAEPSAATSGLPIRNGRATSSTTSSSRPPAHRGLGQPHGGGRQGPRSPHPAQAEFYLRQIANAVSPSNFLVTNPEALRETMEQQRRGSGPCMQNLRTTLRPATAI